MAIMSSSSENPGCVFCFRMFMVFKFELFAFGLYLVPIYENAEIKAWTVKVLVLEPPFLA
jgi:hypothetical protein